MTPRAHIVGAPPIQRVEVNGPVAYQGGDGGAEVDLDTEVIRELAPKAQIVNYEICGGVDGFSAGIDKIVSDGRAKLVNFSYGFCELDVTSQQALITANNSFAAAEAHGVTVFASSGDQRLLRVPALRPHRPPLVGRMAGLLAQRRLGRRHLRRRAPGWYHASTSSAGRTSSAAPEAVEE